MQYPPATLNNVTPPGLPAVVPLIADEPFSVMRKHPACQTLADLWAVAGDGLDLLAGPLARWPYIRQYGYGVLCKELLDTLACQLQGKRVVDAGSGTGYLSAALASRGMNILAVDQGPLPEQEEFHVWRRDVCGDVLPLLPGEFDTVLLCWPSIGVPFAFEVANALPVGQTLIYQGEGEGGCTADDDFFSLIRSEAFELLEAETAALREFNLRHQGIKDNWSVLRRV